MGVYRWARQRSPWIVHFNAASCNGCAIEFFTAMTPIYDTERFGIINTGNPKHADILVMTGGANHRNARVIKNIFWQMPAPKAVVAVGVCACSAGIFHDCYNMLGGVDKVIPVDVYVPGCAARPEAIIEGILRAAELLAESGGEGVGGD
ncbi:MAG TPA: NADH-quinone oxidoreductase subunit NuoB [Firmicutes bacterium]|jgi:Ni,Fe-hydrogenase III small subunit|nr:NADH-quinone oxidoreductase subunit NuoB [Bacillota bacterium]